jgi:predicted DNA-binding transcriptional regulator AlpA
VPGGRPSKLTPEITAAICERIAKGAYVEVAAQASGIGRSTLYRWLKEDSEFQDAVKTARASAMCESIAFIRSGEQGWQGSAWYLERTYPSLYAADRKKKRAEIELTKAKVAESKTLEELLSKASVGELESILAKLLARGRD